MGHSVLPPEYSIHSQTVLENGVIVNEANSSTDLNVGGSTSRKRKHSVCDTDYQFETKKACIFNQLLTDMIIEKEKFLYISLLEKYGCSDEIDIFNLIERNNFANTILPFSNPQHPKFIYFSSESENFKQLLPQDVISRLKPVKRKYFLN